MDCSNVQIKYAGNGSQVLYTFPFEYMDETDIIVGFWNDKLSRWEYDQINPWLNLSEQPSIVSRYYWTFDNATTIRFLQNSDTSDPPTAPVPPPTDWAPPLPNFPTTQIKGANIIIQRRSGDNDLVEFYPGSSIRAQDLNYNFEQLLYLIQEGRCIVPGWFLDYLDTILVTFDKDAVTRPEQINGLAIITDEKFFTTAASAARHDVYHEDNTPAPVPVEQPAKQWFNTSTLETLTWDANAQAWVNLGNAGPPGPTGPGGPPGSFQVSDTPPTEVNIPVAPGEPTQTRPLENGDAWFDSSTGRLYVWYVDTDSSQWVSISSAPGPGTGAQVGDLQEVTDNGNFTNNNIFISRSATNPQITLGRDVGAGTILDLRPGGNALTANLSVANQVNSGLNAGTRGVFISAGDSGGNNHGSVLIHGNTNFGQQQAFTVWTSNGSSPKSPSFTITQGGTVAATREVIIGTSPVVQNGGTAPALTFLPVSGPSDTRRIRFTCPDLQSANQQDDYTLPNRKPTTNSVLQSTPQGLMSWVASGSGNADFANLTAVNPIRVALSNNDQNAQISIDLQTINAIF